VPETLAKAKERKRRTRQAAHRAEAVRVLQIGEATCRYAAATLANGVSPEEAREAALFVAGELTAMAAALRRLTRLGPAERRALARQLEALGLGTHAISQQLGVHERTTRYYLTGKPGYASGRKS
jgi:hypothetical protein